jgi:hypothetical protein
MSRLAKVRLVLKPIRLVRAGAAGKVQRKRRHFVLSAGLSTRVERNLIDNGCKSLLSLLL